MSDTAHVRTKHRPLAVCKVCGADPIQSLVGPFTVSCVCGQLVGPFDRKAQARLAWQSIHAHTIRVPINEDGRRLGEHHPRAKWSDLQVKQVRDLHDQGMNYPAIAAHLGMPYWTVAHIAQFVQRAQVPRDWKRVEAK